MEEVGKRTDTATIRFNDKQAEWEFITTTANISGLQEQAIF